MKTLITKELINCDICGGAMGYEASKMFLEGIYLGEKYVHATVDVSAIYIGGEYKCLCNECRKKILEEAIRKFT